MNYPKSRIEDLLARRDIQLAQVVHLAEVGSTAHGISTSTTDDDFDATVIRIESFSELVTGATDRQSMMIRTQPDGVRSRMGDIDLNVYTLRKFAALAASGNPSILGAIFSGSVHHNTLNLEPLAGMVASKAAGNAFRGYMTQQMERWTGIRGQKNVNRPELVEAYGFDTKYAAHVLRLGHQGIEYMETGRFSMPMYPSIAESIVNVREGKLSEGEALDYAQTIALALKEAHEKSPLPEKPAIEKVKGWLTDVYRERVA